MKFKRCCSSVNFHCMFDTTRTSPIMMQNKISENLNPNHNPKNLHPTHNPQNLNLKP